MLHPPRSRNKDPRVLLIVILCILAVLLATKKASSQTCPQGYKCIPEDRAKVWAEILRERQCQDKVLDAIQANKATSDLNLSLDPYTVIITQEGQVFDPQYLHLQLNYCSTKLHLKVKPNLKVMVKEQHPQEVPEWGFRLRVRLGVVIDGSSLDEDHPFFHPVLGLEPFYWRSFHVMSWIGLDALGVGVGVDMTKNANFFLGYGGHWDGDTGLTVGISLSFN